MYGIYVCCSLLILLCLYGEAVVYPQGVVDGGGGGGGTKNNVKKIELQEHKLETHLAQKLCMPNFF